MDGYVLYFGFVIGVLIISAIVGSFDENPW